MTHVIYVNYFVNSESVYNFHFLLFFFFLILGVFNKGTTLKSVGKMEENCKE